MPNLLPDTSIYPTQPPQQGGIGSMSLGDLVGIAGQLQKLQSQQAMGAAIQKNIDPNAPGGVNWQGVREHYGRNAPLADPSAIQATTSAETSAYDLRLSQTKTAMDAISSLVDKKDLSKKDFAGITPVLARAGVPADMIAGIIASAPDDPAGLRTSLVGMQNWIGGLARAPGVTGPPRATGEETVISPAEQAYRMRGAGAAPSAGGAPAPAPGPGMVVSQPTGFAENVRGGMLPAIDRLRTSYENTPQVRANLENLRDVSNEAATGPTAGFEERANQVWQRFFPGSKLTLTPEQLKSTEEFAKLGEQIAGQQAIAGHATNAFLNNAYGANPNLGLSKLGRNGIINMLLGNQDAQRTLWGEWLKSGKKPAEFDQWLGQFNASFDPRVFQYERMSPDEQQKFLDIIKKTGAKGELGRFTKRLQDYEGKGWIGNAAQ